MMKGKASLATRSEEAIELRGMTRILDTISEVNHGVWIW